MDPFTCLNDDVLNIVLLVSVRCGKTRTYLPGCLQTRHPTLCGRKSRLQVLSFRHFVLSGSPSRAMFLRRLHLGAPCVGAGDKAWQCKCLGNPLGRPLPSLLAEGS